MYFDVKIIKKCLLPTPLSKTAHVLFVWKPQPQPLSVTMAGNSDNFELRV